MFAALRSAVHADIDRQIGRVQERLGYVLSHLQEDGALAAEQSCRGLPALPTLLA